MLGNSSLLKKSKFKSLINADEQLLLLKLVNEYTNSNQHINLLYEILTNTKRKTDAEIAVEAQPLTHRKKEGNTYLDLALGSIKKRNNTVSGIELDRTNNELNFVFCEAKWKSDLSIAVTNCSIRNQLQRIIENALLFAGDNFKGKIFITLITPELYKNSYMTNIHTRFYSYKYKEYKTNLYHSFLKELNLINSLNLIPFECSTMKNHMSTIIKNLNKVVLNWVTFEQLIDGIPNNQSKNYLKKIYSLLNK